MTVLEDSPVTPRGLTHLALRVRDVPRSAEFYRQAMGLRITRQGERAAFLTARGGTSHDLALFALGNEAPGPEEKRVGMYHMAWAMNSFDELQALYSHLVKSDVRIAGFSNSQTLVSVSFFDPDGNEIEALYELPLDEFPAEIVRGQKFSRTPVWEESAAPS